MSFPFFILQQNAMVLGHAMGSASRMPKVPPHQGSRYIRVLLHPRTEATDLPSCVTVNCTGLCTSKHSFAPCVAQRIGFQQHQLDHCSVPCVEAVAIMQRGHQLGIHNRTLVTHMLQTELSNAPEALCLLSRRHFHFQFVHM